MFTLRSFKTQFSVPPSALSNQWKTQFLSCLSRQKNRTVTQSEGVVLEVRRILSLQPPKIVNGLICVTCSYEAVAFCPSVGELYKGKITMILPLGILIEAEGLVKVLIQLPNMPPGYKFDSARKVFANGIHSYSVGDTITFRVVNLKYKPDEINCIGSVKDIPISSRMEERKDDDGEYDEIIEPPDEFE